MAHACNTGNARSRSTTVTSWAHTNTGIRPRLIPLARMFSVVTMKFTEPSSDEAMMMTIAISQIVWPGGAATDKGAYDVQPDCAAPPGARNADSITMPPTRKAQYDIMLRRGNAMSSAPIWSGRTKFPKAATPSGTTPRKIMIVPCMAPSWL